MTTPARQAEADRVEEVYLWALGVLATRTIIDARELWQEVPATRQAASATTWLNAALRLITLRRGLARALGLAYYRLIRALRTGATIQDPSKREPRRISLEGLRDEFDAVLDEIERLLPTAAERADTPEVEPDEQPRYEDADFEDDDEITVEPIENIENLIDDLEQTAMDEAENQLRTVGNELVARRVEKIDTTAPADEVDAKRAEVHDLAGKRQAAAAARVTMNAARGLAYNLADTDKRVIGWVRVSRTGTPCGWCAMLISRGLVYKTRVSAGGFTDGRAADDIPDEARFHDNCMCVAVPVFAQEQYDNSPIFDLNREYKRLWPEVTAGFSGEDAIRVWRRYFREQEKLRAAQEAA